MNYINKQVQPPHFVWVGPGEAADPRLMDQFTEKNPTGQVVFIEARKSAVEKLLKKYEDQDQYTILCKYLDDVSKSATFHTLTFPEFSGLSEPTGLIDLFPGIAIDKSDRVETQAIGTCIQKLKFVTNKSSHLYIDTPSLAGKFIRNLIQNNMLYLFSIVHVSVGVNSLYKDSEIAKSIIVLLRENGFFVFYKDNTDPDIPVISFHLNPLWKELSDVKQQLNDTVISNNTLENQFESKLKETIQLQEKIIALAITVEEKESFLFDAIHKKDVLEVELTEKNTAVTALQVELKENKSLLLDAIHKKEAVDVELTEKNSVVTALQIELQEKQKSLTEIEKWSSGLKIEQATLVGEIQEKDDELEKMLNDKTANMNKLQAKEQAYQEQLYRNQNMEQEVIKLEAQLELIKDVILRDKAF